MTLFEILKKIENFLDRKLLAKKIKSFRIINNDLGKNLILVDTMLDEYEKIKIELNEYESYIDNIFLKSNTEKYLLEHIEEVCPENTIYYTKVSYDSWYTGRKGKEIENWQEKVITGYSFKGGVGRSQTLAYLSLFASMLGKKVVVLDCDFEAPGICTLLCEQKNENESNQKLGIIDYLIDSNIVEKLSLERYYIKNKNIDNLMIFSSGIDFDSINYVNKMSKMDFNSNFFISSFKKMINQIDRELKPDYIFIDLRAGINESNGYFLKEFSNKNLLFFNGDLQNELGMEIIFNQLDESMLKNYYLVNSLIRDYNFETSKTKSENFEKYVREKYSKYDNKIYDLIHESKFLVNSYEVLFTFTANNVSLYNNKFLNLDDMLEKINYLVRNTNANLNPKYLSELIQMRNKLIHGSKNIPTRSDKVSIDKTIGISKNIDIYLMDLIETLFEELIILNK